MSCSFRELGGAAALVFTLSLSAQAGAITYTFSGIASGTLNGVMFTDQNFTATFTGDTSAVDPTNAPYYIQPDISGVFQENGNIADFTANVESNASLGNIDFYDPAATNGLGFQDSSLVGYMLSSSFGPVTAASGNLTPTLGSSTFTTSDGPLQFTVDTSLTFSAVTGAPEPGTIVLLGFGIAALTIYGRRLRKVPPGR